MNHLSRLTIAAVLMTGIPLAAQTKLDLRSQSKSVDFENSTFTKPIRVVATLPDNCSPTELLYLSTAPAGSNLYACVAPNTWVPEAASQGVLTVQNGGVNVGARQTQNFVAGSGLINALTDLGTKVAIQQSVDSSFVVTKPNLQSGSGLLCQSTGGPPTYACSMSPALTDYTTGMVVNWLPLASLTSGVPTLDVDLLGATPILRADGFTVPTNQDIVAGQLYAVWYDGAAFRLPATGGTSTSGGGTSGPPTSITSSNSGGPTTVTGTAEWHAPLALCATGTGAVLAWNVPPTGQTAATASGCTGTNLAEAYASFPNTGTATLQNSVMLPTTLTGKADVYLYYVPTSSLGTFTPVLDLYCTPSDGSLANELPFTTTPFFAPGAVSLPALAGSLGVVSGTAINWPSGCTGGSRAHLRLRRTDTTGTATVNISELVVVMRRVL